MRSQRRIQKVAQRIPEVGTLPAIHPAIFKSNDEGLSANKIRYDAHEVRVFARNSLEIITPLLSQEVAETDPVWASWKVRLARARSAVSWKVRLARSRARALTRARRSSG